MQGVGGWHAERHRLEQVRSPKSDRQVPYSHLRSAQENAVGYSAVPRKPDLKGEMIAARRASLGLSRQDVAYQLLQSEPRHGETVDAERRMLVALAKWVERVEESEGYRGRTGPTRGRYLRLLQILELERDDPVFDVLLERLEAISADIAVLLGKRSDAAGGVRRQRR